MLNWGSFVRGLNEMKLKIVPLENSNKMIEPLAKAYQRSYNELSKGYKSAAEMALYTREVFVGKLQRFAEDKESKTAVVLSDGVPMGFMRLSPIPEYYKHPVNGCTSERECGETDGYTFAWERKVFFDKDIRLDDKTLIINQLYLDPKIQRRNVGTYLLEHTLPQLKERGFDSLILEYNANNHNAEKFYQTLGFEAFARTKDFDHVVTSPEGRAEFCLSDVKIAHTSIDHALEQAEKVKNRAVSKLTGALLSHAAQHSH